MRRQPRVLLAGVGPAQDPQDALEAVGVARSLRDAGWEVVHLGVVVSPAAVAEVALQEDADAVVVLGGGEPVTPCPAVADELARRGLGTVAVIDANDDPIRHLGGPWGAV